MSENQQKSRPIIDFYKQIESGELVLPEFQRDFKWPIDKSVTLFDSIIKNLFIGSLIVSKPKFDLACKGFDLRDRGSKGRKPVPKKITKKEFENSDIYTLLDGQQRATSIYRALTNKDAIYVIFENFVKLSSDDFYISEPKPGEKRIKVDHEQYVAAIDYKKPPEGVFYIRIGDLFNSIALRDNDFWDLYVNPVIDDFNIDETERDIIRDYASEFLSYFHTDIIKKESLLSVQLLDMDLEKFCLYFERSNSQGLNLSFTDIITAKVYIEFKLAKKIAEAKKLKYFNDRLVDPIVRYINFIANGEVTKKSILTNLRGEHFIEYWDNAVQDINSVQDWLEGTWVFNVHDLPYRTMLLPLLSFYQNLKHKEFSQANQKQLDMIKYWFYASMLDHRYGGGGHGSTNVIIKHDCQLLENIAKEKYPDPDFWGSIRITGDYEEFKRSDNHKSAKSMGLAYYAWSKESYKNLENKQNVQMASDVDVHHVFPVSYVRKTFGESSSEYDYVDSVLNKIRINKISNIKIGGKSPSKYLGDIYRVNPSLSDSLSSHSIHQCDELLNGDLDKNYFKFIKTRHKAFSDDLDEIRNAGIKLSNGDLDNVWEDV